MKKSFLFIYCYVFFLICSCGPVSDLGMGREIDIRPPEFICIKSISVTKIEVVFDENANLAVETLTISPRLNIMDIQAEDCSVIINTENMTAGEEYTLSATASDEQRNSLSFAAVFFGFNPVKPRVLINEFTTQGSKAHPDIVEMKVLSDGNLAGLTFYQGVHTNWTDRFVFPECKVKKGDFILLHFKPEKIPEEKDETENKTQSGGLGASIYAFDFWVKGGKGLSGNNGVLTLYDQPHGEIIDGVFYSNRTSESDDLYQGFGSTRNKERAFSLFTVGAWTGSSPDLRPEDGINPDESSATRSLCRSSTPLDTDSKRDWHIVPTSKASFGEENCNEVYSP
jgi:hypothetical protein